MIFVDLNAEVNTHEYAFGSSRLDYSNACVNSLGESALDRMEAIQNVSGRLLPRSEGRSHITSLDLSIQKLPVAFMIQFKTFTLNSKHCTVRVLHVWLI